MLDAACYDASASLALVERFGCRLLGVDLARHGFEARRRAVPDATLGGAGALRAGAPGGAARGDRCLRPGVVPGRPLLRPRRGRLGELARVVRPGGTVLLHTSCATPLLEPRERAELFEVLGLDAGSMDATAVEREAAQAGLEVRERVRVGSQWLQHRLEADPTPGRPAHPGAPDRVARAVRRGLGGDVVPPDPGLAPVADLPGPRQAGGPPVGAPRPAGRLLGAPPGAVGGVAGGRRGALGAAGGRRRMIARRRPAPATPLAARRAGLPGLSAGLSAGLTGGPWAATIGPAVGAATGPRRGLSLPPSTRR